MEIKALYCMPQIFKRRQSDFRMKPRANVIPSRETVLTSFFFYNNSVIIDKDTCTQQHRLIQDMIPNISFINEGVDYSHWTDSVARVHVCRSIKFYFA